MFDDARAGKNKNKRAFILPQNLLGLVLAFPLGILSALASAVGLFRTIIPISVLLGLVCPIAVPLIVILGTLFVSWLLVHAVVCFLLRAGIRTATVASPYLVHVIIAVHCASEVAYMGLYGLFVLAKSKLLEKSVIVGPLHARRPRSLIANMPRTAPFTFLPTPPSLSPPYTPSTSPTTSEWMDASLSLPMTMAFPPSLLSEMLQTLDDEELEVIANYIALRRKGVNKVVASVT